MAASSASRGSSRRTEPGELLNEKVMVLRLVMSHDSCNLVHKCYHRNLQFLFHLLILISCTFVRFSPAVAEVLDKDTPAIFGSDSAAKRNEAFIQEANGGSLLACFVGE